MGRESKKKFEEFKNFSAFSDCNKKLKEKLVLNFDNCLSSNKIGEQSLEANLSIDRHCSFCLQSAMHFITDTIFVLNLHIFLKVLRCL